MTAPSTSTVDITCLRTAAGARLHPVREINEGGEGWVFEVDRPYRAALKLYRPEVLAKRGDQTRRKLAAMVAGPPDNPSGAPGHRMLSWPTDLVVDENGELRGFLMPLLDGDRTVALHQITTPFDRKLAARSNTPWRASFDEWRRLVQVGRNLAAATAAVHAGGYVIGDFNETNVRVDGRALVTVIDCDSMQVRAADGTVFRTEVGKDDYEAPEVVRGGVLTAPADNFALAIHIFTLLMQGRHPFDGVWNGSGDKPSRRDLARQGLYWLAGDARLTAPPGLPTLLMTPGLRDLFRRAFVDGRRDPAARPTARQWQLALEQLGRELRQCGQNSEHWYPREVSACPWCLAAAPAVARPASRPQPSVAQPSVTPQPAVAQPARQWVANPAYRAPSRLNRGIPNRSVTVMCVLGMVCWVFCGVLSVILGIVAFRRARRDGTSLVLPLIVLGGSLLSATGLLYRLVEAMTGS